MSFFDTISRLFFRGETRDLDQSRTNVRNAEQEEQVDDEVNSDSSDYQDNFGNLDDGEYDDDDAATISGISANSDDSVASDVEDRVCFEESHVSVDEKREGIKVFVSDNKDFCTNDKYDPVAVNDEDLALYAAGNEDNDAASVSGISVNSKDSVTSGVEDRVRFKESHVSVDEKREGIKVFVSDNKDFCTNDKYDPVAVNDEDLALYAAGNEDNDAASVSGISVNSKDSVTSGVEDRVRFKESQAVSVDEKREGLKVVDSDKDFCTNYEYVPEAGDREDFNHRFKTISREETSHGNGTGVSEHGVTIVEGVSEASSKNKLQKNFRGSCEAIECEEGIEPRRAEIDVSGELPIRKSTHGIRIEGDLNFGVVYMDRGKTVTSRINNYGSDDVVLLGCVSDRLPNSVQLFADVISGETISPSKCKIVQVSCKPRFFGYTKEALRWKFEGFEIWQTFTFTVHDCYSIIANIYQNRAIYKQPTILFPLDKSDPLTHGSRTITANNLLRTKKFPISRNAWTSFVDDQRGVVNKPDIIKANLMRNFPELTEEVSIQNYINRFDALLFCEEVEEKIAISRYKMRGTFLKKCGGYLVLEVPNLEEQRPSLLPGDRVVITQQWRGVSAKHSGVIEQVAKSTVSIIFHQSFQSSYNGTECDVEFELNSKKYSHLHEAVHRGFKSLGERFLFPERVEEMEPCLKLNDDGRELSWFSNDLNDQQRAAVINILRAECRPLPYIINGPPGTGKTKTVVEAILQVHTLLPQSRLLVCGPSNSACDILAKLLINKGQLKLNQLLRLLAATRSKDTVPQEILGYTTSWSTREDGAYWTEKISSHRIVVTTCDSAAQLHRLSLTPNHYTHVFIDESGYATEPSTMVPISFHNVNSSQVILAGDPEQLGPSVACRIANLGMETSLLSRMMCRPPYRRNMECFPQTFGFNPRLVTRLVVNYRSVPEILRLPSKLFYNDELQSTVSPTEGREAEIISAFAQKTNIRPEPASIVFHGVSGINVQEADSPSWMNGEELCETLSYLEILYDVEIKPEEIAVITPYKKQVSKLKYFLKQRNLEVPEIGSVEELQGQERPVIILSTVRSSSKSHKGPKNVRIGFLNNPRRVNVALTRARALLIIIGDPHILKTDPNWKQVVQYCVDIKTYLGCDLADSGDKIQQ